MKSNILYSHNNYIHESVDYGKMQCKKIKYIKYKGGNHTMFRSATRETIMNARSHV